MRNKIIALFLSQSFVFAAIGISYLVYSRILSVEQFGLYSVALVIGSFATLILDGGLKATIIKHPADLTKKEEGTLFFLMACLSLFLIVTLFASHAIFAIYFPGLKQDYSFLVIFSGIYLVSYPLISIPTATLERRLEYGHIAWIEAVGMAFERAGPAMLLVYSHYGMSSFLWALFVGRAFRIGALMMFYRPGFHIPVTKDIGAAFHLIQEGSWLQIATGASLLRDSMHVLLVGPMFGKVWVGYYAWALQLSMIASQVFVQLSSRVSLPLFSQDRTMKERWPVCLYQVKLLSMFTIPVLAMFLILMPSVDAYYFKEKWQIAITLLPFLFARMLPGLATTPVGTLLLVERGARVFARANILWAGFELVAGFIFLLIAGPKGLAWSYSWTAWIGLLILHRAIEQDSGNRMLTTVRTLLKRPALWFSLGAILSPLLLLMIGVIPLTYVQDIRLVATYAIAIVILSYSLEKDIRKMLRFRS